MVQYNGKQIYNIIIYQDGEHTVRLATCACEPLVVYGSSCIWPSSPQLAYTFDLLDWTEALLECLVSVEDFCKAIQFKCQHLVMKVSIPLKGYFRGARGAFAPLPPPAFRLPPLGLGLIMSRPHPYPPPQHSYHIHLGERKIRVAAN